MTTKQIKYILGVGAYMRAVRRSGHTARIKEETKLTFPPLYMIEEGVAEVLVVGVAVL